MVRRIIRLRYAVAVVRTPIWKVEVRGCGILSL